MVDHPALDGGWQLMGHLLMEVCVLVPMLPAKCAEIRMCTKLLNRNVLSITVEDSCSFCCFIGTITYFCLKVSYKRQL